MVVVQNRALISDDGRYITIKMMMCQCLLALIMHCVGTQTSHPGSWGVSAILCRNVQRRPRLVAGAAEVRVEGTLHRPGAGGPAAIAENAQAGPPGSFSFLDL